MTLLRSFLPFAVLLSAVLPAAAQSTCPVTLPSQEMPERPDGFPVRDGTEGPGIGSFDFGTPELWVLAPRNSWSGLPLWDVGYRQKIVWYSSHFNLDAGHWREGPRPELTITGRRLDGNADPLISDGGNGTYVDNMGSFIMSAVNFPTVGCWEISGHLGDASTTFVVEVVP